MNNVMQENDTLNQYKLEAADGTFQFQGSKFAKN